MIIKLKLYGSSKLLSKKDYLIINLPNNSKPIDLRRQVKKIIGKKKLNSILKNLSSSVVFSSANDKIINDNYRFKNNEIISVIPPIGGGWWIYIYL